MLSSEEFRQKCFKSTIRRIMKIDLSEPAYPQISDVNKFEFFRHMDSCIRNAEGLEGRVGYLTGEGFTRELLNDAFDCQSSDVEQVRISVIDFFQEMILGKRTGESWLVKFYLLTSDGDVVRDGKDITYLLTL